jgi:hypothetical protein
LLSVCLLLSHFFARTSSSSFFFFILNTFLHVPGRWLIERHNFYPPCWAS